MVGCSVDTLGDQQAFARKYDLRFPLVADASAEIAKAYGTYRDDWTVAGRATAVIAEDGMVVKAYPKAEAKGHAQEVLDVVRAVVEGTA